MPWSVFEKLNYEREKQEESLFANPRNAASGTLKLQNSAEVARRQLDAYLYYLLGDKLPADTHYDNLKSLFVGFKISNSMKNALHCKKCLTILPIGTQNAKICP